MKAKVIPFIGAGLTIPLMKEVKNIPISVTEMKIEIVKQMIKYKKNGSKDKNKWLNWCCELVNIEQQKEQNYKCKNICLQKNFDINKKEHIKKCFLFSRSFFNLCEVFTWITGKKGFEELVKLFKINEFNNLTPTPAHRYIAFLAREGLIEEVITTNYDTLIEKAFRDTYGYKEENNKDDPAKPITSLEEYRNEGGNLYININGNKKRCLKIYKINGCAKQHPKEHSERILLTERQLQDWRDRFWAKDLFKDRLRSRTLLFSGFGSGEPQVRHTALQVAEEFSLNGTRDKSEKRKSNWWELPNSPFISAYNTELSFTQMQIMYAYAEAYNKDKDIIDFNEITQNAFTGKDGRYFENTEDKLPADYFWSKIYRAVFYNLFKEQCKEGSTIYAYISSVYDKANRLLHDMQKFYEKHLLKKDSFGILKVNQNHNNTTPLSCWMHKMRYANKRKITDGWYLPLTDKPLYICLVMLFIYLFYQEQSDKNLEDIIYDDGDYFGFHIKLFHQNYLVLLTHSDNGFRSNQKIIKKDFKDDLSIIQLIISNDFFSKPEKVTLRIQKQMETGIKVEKAVIANKISVWEIFKWMSKKNNHDKVLTSILENILIHHGKEIDKQRPKVRDNTIPIEKVI